MHWYLSTVALVFSCCPLGTLTPQVSEKRYKVFVTLHHFPGIDVRIVVYMFVNRKGASEMSFVHVIWDHVSKLFPHRFWNSLARLLGRRSRKLRLEERQSKQQSGGYALGRLENCECELDIRRFRGRSEDRRYGPHNVGGRSDDVLPS